MSAFDRNRVPDWRAYANREGLSLSGRGKWLDTLCAFHDDGKPSMRVNVESGGWCCMSCGVKGGDVLSHYMQRTGLGFVAAATALGAYHPDACETGAPMERRRALSARDSLELLYQDSLLVWVAATNLAHGTALTDRDRADLSAAARRVMLVSQEAA